MVCRSEYAVYRRQAKLLDLSGFPVVFKKNDEFRADRIRVDLETDDVTMEGSVSGSIMEKEKEADAEEAPETETAEDAPSAETTEEAPAAETAEEAPPPEE